MDSYFGLDNTDPLVIDDEYSFFDIGISWNSDIHYDRCCYLLMIEGDLNRIVDIELICEDHRVDINKLENIPNIFVVKYPQFGELKNIRFTLNVVGTDMMMIATLSTTVNILTIPKRDNFRLSDMNINWN